MTDIIYDNSESTETPKKYDVTFMARDKTVGVLKFEDGVLSFEGDADASAKIFIEALANNWGFPQAVKYTQIAL